MRSCLVSEQRADDDLKPEPLRDSPLSSQTPKSAVSPAENTGMRLEETSLLSEATAMRSTKQQAHKPVEKWFSRADPEVQLEDGPQIADDNEISQLQQEVTGQAAEIAELLHELQEVKHSNAQLHEQASFYKTQCNDLSGKCASLSAQLNEYKINESMLNQKLQRLYSEIDVLKTGNVSSAVPAIGNCNVLQMEAELAAKSDELNREKHLNLCLQAQICEMRRSSGDSQLITCSSTEPSGAH